MRVARGQKKTISRVVPGGQTVVLKFLTKVAPRRHPNVHIVSAKSRKRSGAGPNRSGFQLPKKCYVLNETETGSEADWISTGTRKVPAGVTRQLPFFSTKNSWASQGRAEKVESKTTLQGFFCDWMIFRREDLLSDRLEWVMFSEKARPRAGQSSGLGFSEKETESLRLWQNINVTSQLTHLSCRTLIHPFDQEQENWRSRIVIRRCQWPDRQIRCTWNERSVEFSRSLFERKKQAKERNCFFFHLTVLEQFSAHACNEECSRTLKVFPLERPRFPM